ncbi:MAG: CapA family protein [Peptococcaceae bacterium]|nr:CapA family protein [Peptococcaceae bacterium]
MRTNKKPFIFVVLAIFTLAVGIGAFWAIPQLFQPPDPHISSTETTPNSPEPAFVDIDLACVGDILIHSPIIDAAKTDTGYDFRPIFTYVKPYLEKADLTLANLEGSLGGPSQKYSGYPLFNCPDTIVDALKDAGVDVLNTANNHCFDSGEEGFFRTIDTVRGKGLGLIGTRKIKQEPSYDIKTVKGLSVGIISFGYASYIDSGLNINGNPAPASIVNLLNFLDYTRLDSELEKLRTTVAAARTDGAQIIIVHMHWGEEYQLHSHSLQQRAAQELANLKVDVIFGSHPHVLQEATYVAAASLDHKTPVYYSLGNFISNQRVETLNNINTEHGLIAQITLRHHSDGRNEILNSSYIATWVNKKTGAKTLYEIIPVAQALDDLNAFPNLVPADRSRLLSCQESVENLMAGIKP